MMSAPSGRASLLPKGVKRPSTRQLIAAHVVALLVGANAGLLSNASASHSGSPTTKTTTSSVNIVARTEARSSLPSPPRTSRLTVEDWYQARVALQGQDRYPSGDSYDDELTLFNTAAEMACVRVLGITPYDTDPRWIPCLKSFGV